ncbi:MAG: HNH endonuclease, partial [Ktedonobacteraceae bacterium]
PHRYGGGNIERVPDVVKVIAVFFRRTPGSITSKMLNLDGSRSHSSRLEPLLYATLVDQPDLYTGLYRKIIRVAREIAIEADILPDFLQEFGIITEKEALLGQYELPTSTHQLLREASAQMELERVDQTFQLGDRLTEKLVEQKVRLVQHYFAHDVLQNYAYTCAFCGFAPHTLLQSGSGLLRASHIKPWAASTEQEKVDMRNGLAACPMHDAAFDRGYLAVENTYSILRAEVLQKSVERDQGVRPYFDDLLSSALILPATAKRPAINYLEYHRRFIFRDG